MAGAKGTYLTRQRSIVARFTQLEYEDRYDRMAGAERIDFIDTYSAAYRRDVFLANGGFDHAHLVGNEDQEFSFRLAEKGYRLVFAPAAQVYHQHNRTLGAVCAAQVHASACGKCASRASTRPRWCKDSHTPGALKLQLLLAATEPGAAARLDRRQPAAWSSRGGWVGPRSSRPWLLFDVTALPFYAKIARRDPAVLLPGLALMWVRALALGFGFAQSAWHVFPARLTSPGPRSPWRSVRRSACSTLSVAGLTLIVMALPMAGHRALDSSWTRRAPSCSGKCGSG